MRLILSILTGALAGNVLLAAPIAGNSITFDFLQNGEQVLTYYDGGFGSLGTGPGPLFGVSFTPGLTANSTIIAFGPSALVAAPVTMDLDNPWSQIMSFYFLGTGSVAFYSGKDASGAQLLSAPLAYSGPFGFPFASAPGSFQSVVFSPATSGSLRIDSITFGSAVIPEPSTAILAIAGILVTFCLQFKRGRQPTPTGRRLG